MAEHANVVRIASFRPGADRRAELLDRLKSGIDGIRQMEGCFGAQICSVEGDPEVVAVISRWASRSALDQFLSSTTTQRAEAAAMTTEPPKTETYTSM